MTNEFAVRFVDAPGFADSDWLILSPGISVLTGRNNVGKSRLLTQVRDLQTSVSNSQVSDAIPQLRIKDEQIEITADVRGVPPGPLWEVRDRDRLVAKTFWTAQSGSWSLRYETAPQQFSQLYLGPPPTGVNALPFPEIQRVNTAVRRIVYLPPQRVVEATVITQPVDVPSAAGADLGQAIYKHRNAVTEEFQEFEAAVSEVLPEVSMVLTDPISQQQVTIKLRDRYAGFDVPIDRAGTGVNQLLHLIATVLFTPHGRLLLIDEPQLHLHPGAEKALAAFIRRHPEHDYVMATHSPVFVNALAPDRAWLLTRDGRGTRVRSVFGERLSRAHVLQEIGLTPGDIVLGERVLLVEGASDVEVLRTLLGRIGWDPVRMNCMVLQLQGGDNARPLRDVVAELQRTLNLPMMILLDGDKAQSIQASDVVAFLPASDIETILIRDAGAVRRAFDELLQDDLPEGFNLDGWRLEWPTQRIQSYINEHAEEQPERKGARILADLAWAMGQLRYKKSVHGPRIAAHISTDSLGDLAAVLQRLFGEVVPVPQKD